MNNIFRYYAAFFTFRFLRSLIRDFNNYINGYKNPLVPPTRFMFDGPADINLFKENGKEFFRYFIDLCHLRKNEKILDVGCGIGRKAIPLIGYINENGLYEGFDTVRIHINWCKKNISNTHKNFNFRYLDIYNKHYNKYGKQKASVYKFPFKNETFDFVIVGSVFTHMLPVEVGNYFLEISRVLKRKGRTLITFFLLNDYSIKQINEKKSEIDFNYQYDNYMTTDKNISEKAIAYDELFIKDLYATYELKIKEPIHYGSWCARNKYLSYQDIIIAYKN